jgi:hypothetical protein
VLGSQSPADDAPIPHEVRQSPPLDAPQNPATAASPPNAPQQGEANNDGSGFKVNPPAHTSIYSRCLADLPDRTAENHTTEATPVMVFFPSLSFFLRG